MITELGWANVSHIQSTNIHSIYLAILTANWTLNLIHDISMQGFPYKLKW